MVDVGEVHFRALYVVAGVGVLALLRKPIRHPDRPGSRWLGLTIGGLSLWLVAVGLYYVATDLASALALYNLVLFAVTLCFVGWVLIAIEFATRESPPRPILYGLGAFAAVHFLLLWTNYLWLHELVYGATAFVDAGGGLNVPRGPLFWVHIVTVYLLLFVATVLFTAEWANASGLRRRQAGILAATPALGVGTNVLWFAEVLPFPYDPTPIGVTAGVLVLTWALYRAEFLEIAPVGRETVVAEMTDAVVIIDDGDRVVDWNRAALELFGIDDPTAGMRIEAFFRAIPSETLGAFVGTDRAETQVSVEIGGRERHVSVLLSPVKRDDGETIGRIVVARDVSVLKRREQQLLRQNEYLDEFAAIVSHDLQGPLMGIRASADRALRTGELTHVEGVLDAADRMDQLTDDLLELARSGQRIADTEPMELHAVAESARRHMWTGDATITIEDDSTIVADPDRVQQLLENLFRNSVEHGSGSDRTRPGTRGGHDSTDGRTASGDGVEYDRYRASATGASSDVGPPTSTDGDDITGTGGERLTITVGTLPDGFYVADDGDGIPLGDRDRIFERGYTTGDGTGLGLSIVKRIVGAHGWSVQVTESDGGGTRFEITGVEFT
jgi:PAS domain S-box-containing protein